PIEISSKAVHKKFKFTDFLFNMELNVQHQDQDDKKSNHSEQNPTHDCVFGELTEEGPNYRNVGFVGTVVLMMKTQIGLGVLAVPTAFDTLGIVPGVICLSLVACIITWSNCVIGTFKLNHPEIYSIDDAGALIFGRIGRGVLSVAFCLYWIFVVGSGALVMIIVIAVGIQDRPASAPLTDTPWVSDYQIIAHPSFTQGIAAVSKIVFALSGTPGFFAIVSEMRDPRKYTQAVLICQVTVTAVFMTIGCVVYYYCGSYVASPALGSAGGIIKKISYGFAMPGLIVTTTICTHVTKHSSLNSLPRSL
ncbi:transmembrane amino acid transporter protein-domain-containing protein, partial [Penicillium brevicompactum]|uniref:transmembrane amino acid transporter protein-domain-containing protein n=1 Tax=Penicillium brevicompactum TaxID=5074 RepID=UPI002540AF3A